MTTNLLPVIFSDAANQQLERMLSPIDECVAIYLLQQRLPESHAKLRASQSDAGRGSLFSVRLLCIELGAIYADSGSQLVILECWMRTDDCDPAAFSCVIDNDGSEALVAV